jgi:hypothetical protein
MVESVAILGMAERKKRRGGWAFRIITLLLFIYLLLLWWKSWRSFFIFCFCAGLVEFWPFVPPGRTRQKNPETTVANANEKKFLLLADVVIENVWRNPNREILPTRNFEWCVYFSYLFPFVQKQNFLKKSSSNTVIAGQSLNNVGYLAENYTSWAAVMV